MRYLVVFLMSLCFTGLAQKNKKTIFSGVTNSQNKATKPSFTSASLTDNEIAKGLKEALSIGARNASDQLSLLDGYNKNLLVRIPFPPEVSQVSSKLRNMGFGKKVDEFEITLNRAAEKAAKDATPIFFTAISQMTINDANTILKSGNSAATSYLKHKTGDALYASFSPTISLALNSTLATSKWKEITTIYNRIPFVTPVQTDLVKYTTNKALVGLFTIVAIEEKKIRENPSARVTDILQKVFGNVNK